MKSSINSTIQQWQQQHPNGSKLELLEAVKEAASVNTRLWHDNYKQQQQRQRRDLLVAVRLAQGRLQLSQHDAQLTSALLALTHCGRYMGSLPHTGFIGLAGSRRSLS